MCQTGSRPQHVVSHSMTSTCVEDSGVEIGLETEKRQSRHVAYRGRCQCSAINFEFQSTKKLDSNATFYACDCYSCFQRGYLLFVVPLKRFRFISRSASDLGTYGPSEGMDNRNSIDPGNFLHCFCRHCGIPLWVECDGILDYSPLNSKNREILGTKAVTIGINMRTVYDIPVKELEKAHVKMYSYTGNDNCVLDALAAREIVDGD